MPRFSVTLNSAAAKVPSAGDGSVFHTEFTVHAKLGLRGPLVTFPHSLIDDVQGNRESYTPAPSSRVHSIVEM